MDLEAMQKVNAQQRHESDGQVIETETLDRAQRSLQPATQPNTRHGHIGLRHARRRHPGTGSARAPTGSI